MADHHAPLALVPGAKNVVPFRSTASAETKTRELSPVEHNAFRELARQLTARLKGEEKGKAEATIGNEGFPKAALPESVVIAQDEVDTREHTTELTSEEEFADAAAENGPAVKERPLLDRLPVGILVYRFDQLLYANRAFLDWTGYESLMALSDAGGTR